MLLDFQSGSLRPHTSRVDRRLSDVREVFADATAVDAALSEGDPVVYEVLQYDLPEEVGQLICCTTVLHPGQVGGEFFMTKGHFHSVRGTGEVYLGLSGHGYLLLMNEQGESSESPIGPGTVAYVPPGWAHRTVNTGEAPFVFFAVYPGHAGHDYAAVEKAGFPRRVFQSAEGFVLR